MRTWTLGTDWGSYLYWNEAIQFDWAILKAGGCKFFATRGDQELISDTGNYSAVKNILAARQAGIQVCGSYYWHFPHLKQAQIIEQYKRAIEREKPDFIAVDAEQTSYFVSNDDPRHPIDKAMASATLEELCDALKAAYPELPFLLYSRLDYLLNYTPGIIPRISKYDLWLAGWLDYGLHVYEMPLDKLTAGYVRDAIIAPDVWQQVNVMQDGTPPEIAGAKTLVWQHTSRIIPTYPGKTAPAYHQYDFNFWLGDEASLLNWAKSGGYTPPTEPPTTGGSMIHNKDVAQSKRAWVMTVESDQKLTVGWKDTWVDAYILSMGGVFFRKLADGNKRLFIEADTSFAGRCSEVALAGLPVVGRFVLDAGALLKAGWTASAAEAPLKENEITKALMNAWCGANWTWDQVLTKKAAWREVAAIELELINTSGYPDSAVVGNDWQKRVIKTVTDHIKYLQDGGFAPNIPIILYTTPGFLAQYDKPDTDFALWLAGQTGWLWLHLRQTTLDSTATFYAPTNVFAFPPADAFTWSYCPAGYFERVVMHEFTYGKQKLTCLVDAGGAASEAGLSLGCDDAAWLFKFLDIEAPVPPVEPPVEPPAPELSELYEAIAELRDDMTLFHDEIIAGLEELTERLKNL